MARKFVLCASVLSVFFILTSATQSFATDETEIKATEQIKKDPAMMQMLKKIEQSKKILAEMQEQKKQQAQKAQQMQEIRKNTQAKILENLNRMNKDNEPYTPQNAFARFVSKKPTETHDIYWSMFNYQQEKIKSAKDARDKVLTDGGKKQDAWSAYYKISATNRAKIIEINRDFNIKYVNANTDIQRAFDEKGKLPRTD
jgi:hypothetical protein